MAVLPAAAQAGNILTSWPSSLHCTTIRDLKLRVRELLPGVMA